MTRALTPPRFAPLLTSLAAIAAALILGGVFLALRGKDPLAAYASAIYRSGGPLASMAQPEVRRRISFS